MHKNMQKLYESIGNYFAFDPHTVSVEDFFGELASFRFLFMVSVEFLLSLRMCTETPAASKLTRTQITWYHHPHIYVISAHTLI